MKRALIRLAVSVLCLLGGAAFGLAHLLRPPRRPDRVRGKVLVIKLWAIGEVVMATPVLEALKRHEPGCQVHVLVGRAAAPVVEHNPFCDKVIAVDEAVFLRLRLRKILGLAAELRRERYDAAVVLHHSFIFGLFAWLAGIPVRAGLDRAGEGFALTVRVPRPGRPTHRVDEYLSAVAALGVPTGGLKPGIVLGEDAERAAEEVLSGLGLRGGERGIVGLLPTGGTNAAAAQFASDIVAKRWPVEHYAELARQLAAEGHDVLVMGGPGELALRPAFEEAAASGVHVLIGATSLAATMGLLRRCRAVVTNDSGPMHIADALGARLVAVFGPTDPRVVGPYGQPGAVLSAHEGCSPCFDESVFPNRVADCGHPTCMSSVTVDRVLAAVNDLVRPDASARQGAGRG